MTPSATMKRLGYLLMLIGVLIAVFGMVQLAWVIVASVDTNPNRVGNGVIMALSWYAGIALFGLGGWMRGVFRQPLI